MSNPAKAGSAVAAVCEPEVVVIAGGVVSLGVPEFPTTSKLPHPWTARNVYVPAFGIAKYAVTVGQYLAFADATGYAIAGELRSDPRFGNQGTPVAFTSWIDAVRYAQWLARETGKHYRLVRDAEYEKAARGGLIGKLYPWGDEAPPGRCDCNNPNGSPMPVGSFPPNFYGLYDMSGSMWSWCEECYEQVAADAAKMSYEDTQIKDTRLNPICRGGSYKSAEPTVLQYAYRHEDPIDGRFDCIGFRLALTLR